MQRNILQGVLVVVILASTIMFALVALEGTRLSTPPPTAAFAPDVPIVPAGWLHGRSHVVVFSPPAQPDETQRLSSRSL
ncbi:MAG: hypothetical protein ABFD96_02310 [Armatimonadia bacterium]